MNRPAIWLALLILLVSLAYWPGLHGQFIYDDISNFEALTRWAFDQESWRAVLLEHNAGPLGRSVAMATFLFNAATTGMNPFFFKLTNLLLHLVIGLIVYAVILRLARRDLLLNRSAENLALVITAIWLLHPMMVGTVLYVVQRMAMLSVLFMLLAVLAYLVGRERIEAGHARSGALWIWIGVPTFTLLGALSKENALLAPLLCALVEWVYFRPKPDHRRPRSVRAFLWAALGIPTLSGLALLMLRPEFVLQGFENRPFSLAERLLTQGRVLFDYVGNLLLPIGPKMSLFRDDYTISTGLFSPWTTALAWLAWTGVIAAALRLRRRIPAFTAGVGIFLVGHAMESSIFPLMIYFEHRNYLPALGVFLAAAGLLTWAFQQVRASLDHPKTLARVVLGALLVVLGGATFARASLWSSNEALLQQSLTSFPDSRTTRVELAQIEMNRFPPNIAAAQDHYRHLLRLPRASTRIIGAAGLLASSCHSGTPLDASALDALLSEKPDTIESDFISALTALTEIVVRSDCKFISPSDLASRIAFYGESSQLPSTSVFVWQLHYRAAQLHDHAGNLQAAEDQAQKAWLGDSDQIAVGLLLTKLKLEQGSYDDAAGLISTLEKMIDSNISPAHTLLEEYRMIFLQTADRMNED